MLIWHLEMYREWKSECAQRVEAGLTGGENFCSKIESRKVGRVDQS